MFLYSMDGETEREKDMHFSNAYNDEDDELVLCKGQIWFLCQSPFMWKGEF